MAAYPITAHEYRYNTGSAFVAWITCSLANTRDNGNGTYTVFGIPNAPISAGNFEVRVKANGDVPASSVLSNNVEFTGDASLGVVEIFIEGLDDVYEVYGRKAGESAYTLWVDHKKSFPIGETLDDLEVMEIEGWVITPTSQDVVVEAYTAVTYTAVASGGAPTGNLLAGFTYLLDTDIDTARENTDAWIYVEGGTFIYDNDNGQLILPTNLKFNPDSEIAFRILAAVPDVAEIQNGLIGARVAADSGGVEQGLGAAIDSSVLKAFYVKSDDNTDFSPTPISILDWCVGKFEEGSPNVLTWRKTSDGINFTPIVLSGSFKVITVGSYLVLQSYADSVNKRALSAVQYKGLTL